MAKIKKSVGKGGKNEKTDVEEVQKLLNVFQKECGFAKLKVDGDAGSKTQKAIASFEKLMGVKSPKSKFEPGSKEMKDLNTPVPTKLVIKAMAAYAEAEAMAKKAGIAAKIAEEYFKKGITDPALIPKGKANVTGTTTGVDAKLVSAMKEISAHFGEPIRVTSGKRSKKEQGEVMFKYWTENLERGKIYAELRSNPDRMKTLDDYFNAGKKSEFVSLVEKDATKYSRHVTGTAIDIAKNTNSKVVKALESVCRVLTENTCYHLDDSGKAFPSKITDDMRRKWKR